MGAAVPSDPHAALPSDPRVAVSSDRLHPANLLVRANAEYACVAEIRPNEANENQRGSMCELNSKQI